MLFTDAQVLSGQSVRQKKHKYLKLIEARTRKTNVSGTKNATKQAKQENRN